MTFTDSKIEHRVCESISNTFGHRLQARLSKTYHHSTMRLPRIQYHQQNHQEFQNFAHASWQTRHSASWAARTLRKYQRISCAAQPSDDQPRGRRDVIQSIYLYGVYQTFFSASSAAQASSSEEEQQVTQAQTTVPVKPKLFIARDFLFEYPRGWKLIESEDSTFRDSMSDRRRQNVVRGEVVSSDGNVTVSVIQQQASKLKQALFQITNISQLGSAEEVAKLVLPPGSRVDSVSTRTFPVPPKDTGTLMGVIERDPVVVYRYSARLSNGVRSEIAVGIILGRVLILGAGCAEEQWAGNEAVIKAIADSFKLLPR